LIAEFAEQTLATAYEKQKVASSIQEARKALQPEPL
jgi:hypothetical protein